MKDNKQQTVNRLNELKDKYTNNEKVNKMEMERKDTELKVILPAENMETEHNKRPPQSTARKAMDRREHHKQIHKQENKHKSRQAVLFLGHYVINQIKIFT